MNSHLYLVSMVEKLHDLDISTNFEISILLAHNVANGKILRPIFNICSTSLSDTETNKWWIAYIYFASQIELLDIFQVTGWAHWSDISDKQSFRVLFYVIYWYSKVFFCRMLEWQFTPVEIKWIFCRKFCL